MRICVSGKSRLIHNSMGNCHKGRLCQFFHDHCHWSFFGRYQSIFDQNHQPNNQYNQNELSNDSSDAVLEIASCCENQHHNLDNRTAVVDRQVKSQLPNGSSVSTAYQGHGDIDYRSATQTAITGNHHSSSSSKSCSRAADNCGASAGTKTTLAQTIGANNGGGGVGGGGGSGKKMTGGGGDMSRQRSVSHCPHHSGHRAAAHHYDTDKSISPSARKCCCPKSVVSSGNKCCATAVAKAETSSASTIEQSSTKRATSLRILNKRFNFYFPSSPSGGGGGEGNNKNHHHQHQHLSSSKQKGNHNAASPPQSAKGSNNERRNSNASSASGFRLPTSGTYHHGSSANHQIIYHSNNILRRNSKRHKNHHMKLNELNDRSLKHIFEFLTLKERLLNERVCRRWQSLIRMSLLAPASLKIGEHSVKCNCTCEYFPSWELPPVKKFSRDDAGYIVYPNSILRYLLPLCPNLKCLNFSHCYLDDQALQIIIAYCDKIECLHLHDIRLEEGDDDFDLHSSTTASATTTTTNNEQQNLLLQHRNSSDELYSGAPREHSEETTITSAVSAFATEQLAVFGGFVRKLSTRKRPKKSDPELAAAATIHAAAPTTPRGSNVSKSSNRHQPQISNKPKSKQRLNAHRHSGSSNNSHMNHIDERRRTGSPSSVAVESSSHQADYRITCKSGNQPRSIVSTSPAKHSPTTISAAVAPPPAPQSSSSPYRYNMSARKSSADQIMVGSHQKLANNLSYPNITTTPPASSTPVSITSVIGGGSLITINMPTAGAATPAAPALVDNVIACNCAHCRNNAAFYPNIQPQLLQQQQQQLQSPDGNNTATSCAFSESKSSLHDDNIDHDDYYHMDSSSTVMNGSCPLLPGKTTHSNLASAVTVDAFTNAIGQRRAQQRRREWSRHRSTVNNANTNALQQAVQQQAEKLRQQQQQQENVNESDEDLSLIVPEMSATPLLTTVSTPSSPLPIFTTQQQQQINSNNNSIKAGNDSNSSSKRLIAANINPANAPNISSLQTDSDVRYTSNSTSNSGTNSSRSSASPAEPNASLHQHHHNVQQQQQQQLHQYPHQHQSPQFDLHHHHHQPRQNNNNLEHPQVTSRHRSKNGGGSGGGGKTVTATTAASSAVPHQNSIDTTLAINRNADIAAFVEIEQRRRECRQTHLQNWKAFSKKFGTQIRCLSIGGLTSVDQVVIDLLLKYCVALEELRINNELDILSYLTIIKHTVKRIYINCEHGIGLECVSLLAFRNYAEKVIDLGRVDVPPELIDSVISTIGSNFGNLRSLHLRLHNFDIDVSTPANLLFSNLYELNLQFVSGSVDLPFKKLIQLGWQSVQALTIQFASITEESVRTIGESLPQLRKLVLHAVEFRCDHLQRRYGHRICNNCSHSVWKSIATLPHLSALKLHRFIIDSEITRALSRMHRLTQLDLSYCSNVSENVVSICVEQARRTPKRIFSLSIVSRGFINYRQPTDCPNLIIDVRVDAAYD